MSFRGIMPTPTMNKDDTTDFPQTRFLLREAWNNKYRRNLGTHTRLLTPFRAVNNAGDILCRQNYTCGGSSQTPSSRPGLRGLKLGSIHNVCDGTGVEPTTCNPKYVYDSSNYTTYLKQKASTNNYNDSSFVGTDSSNSQSALRRVHRF